ncbi:MAG: segregation/condensation protein A [Candidatus Zambryskibacteria bacterium]|nr:segregation/condensation protein A [Candidatus Zambryskibacteria bacterium]
MDTLTYSVKTDVFEGPLDALLSMIEKRKLQINDISLSKVADDYVTYVRSQVDFPLADSASFILVASTLVLIKSKSLLPTLSLSEEEEKSIDDLEHRLKVHQEFKQKAEVLKKLFGQSILFGALPKKQTQVVFAPDCKTTQIDLHHAIRKVLVAMPKVEIMPRTVVKKIISLEEAIVSLTDRISRSLKLNFREFAGVGKAEKVAVVVNFLAMLELVKQGVIQVKQERAFQDIEMETSIVGVPRY